MKVSLFYFVILCSHCIGFVLFSCLLFDIESHLITQLRACWCGHKFMNLKSKIHDDLIFIIWCSSNLWITKPLRIKNSRICCPTHPSAICNFNILIFCNNLAELQIFYSVHGLLGFGCKDDFFFKGCGSLWGKKC